MDRVQFESGGGTAVVEKWAPRDIRVRLRCDGESRIVFHQFYYPGWTSRFPVDSTPQGQIRVTAPAGDHELRLWLDGGRMETAGKWISALSLAILALAAGFIDRW